ncbi:MAG: hypothetical protein EPO68_16260 [Planctomycetota bacterium]|nr:MAG: hypothetical protein EPO68_16260 [Planctomycetota bacterium]
MPRLRALLVGGPLLVCAACAFAWRERARPAEPREPRARPVVLPASMRLGTCAPAPLDPARVGADARGHVAWRSAAGAPARDGALAAARVELDADGRPRALEFEAELGAAHEVERLRFERSGAPSDGSAAFASADGWSGAAQWCAHRDGGAALRLQAQRASAELCAELELAAR